MGVGKSRRSRHSDKVISVAFDVRVKGETNYKFLVRRILLPIEFCRLGTKFPMLRISNLKRSPVICSGQKPRRILHGIGLREDGEPINKSPSPRPHPVALRPAEGTENQQARSDADTRVCDVKRGPGIFVHVEVKKIRHRSAKNPIGKISQDTAGK